MHAYASLTLPRVLGTDILWPRRPLGDVTIRALCALSDRVGLALRTWRAHVRAERDRAALVVLSDHLLRDIGISRHQIQNPVAGDRFSWRFWS